MPRYPDYRFARELHDHGHRVDEHVETAFLRVFPDSDGRLRARLHPAPGPGGENDWSDGETLTDTADALRARAEHGGDETLEREHLLAIAYARLDLDTATPRNVYVPESLRPWAARFTIQRQPTLVHVQAATASGARCAAIESVRLAIRDDDEAKFTPMQ